MAFKLIKIISDLLPDTAMDGPAPCVSGPFAENAVLIDTAGRYTTQASDQAVDQAGWLGFLDLLQRRRPRQPLKGITVAIAIPDIMTATPDERVAHARAIRQRVKEITTRLGVQVPVYAVLTKVDLIAGFSEFYDDLDRARRDWVWRVTFANAAVPQGQIISFGTEFGLLIKRVQHRFTSDTQEGTPIDRLTGVLSPAFGLDQQRAPSLRPQFGRSYCLTRLLREVVFGEAIARRHYSDARAAALHMAKRWLSFDQPAFHRPAHQLADQPEHECKRNFRNARVNHKRTENRRSAAFRYSWTLTAFIPLMNLFSSSSCSPSCVTQGRSRELDSGPRTAQS